VWPVHLDVVTEIAFRPNLPDASKSAGHRNDSRRKVAHAGCTEELRERLLRFFVDQRRQPQRLDPGTIMIRGCLDPPVDVSDMFEERHREMKLARCRGRGDDRIRATLRKQPSKKTVGFVHVLALAHLTFELGPVDDERDDIEDGCQKDAAKRNAEPVAFAQEGVPAKQ
jgi:hypothetical protein